MKRSPIKRGAKPMARNTRVRPVSKKRASLADERTRCREVVLARDPRCRADGLAPVQCQGGSTDVHELGRGHVRELCWLNPDLCLGLCRQCHRWVTDNPKAAQALGLALPSWEILKLVNPTQ